MAAIDACAQLAPVVELHSQIEGEFALTEVEESDATSVFEKRESIAKNLRARGNEETPTKIERLIKLRDHAQISSEAHVVAPLAPESVHACPVGVEDQFIAAVAFQVVLEMNAEANVGRSPWFVLHLQHESVSALNVADCKRDALKIVEAINTVDVVTQFFPVDRRAGTRFNFRANDSIIDATASFDHQRVDVGLDEIAARTCGVQRREGLRRNREMFEQRRLAAPVVRTGVDDFPRVLEIHRAVTRNRRRQADVGAPNP